MILQSAVGTKYGLVIHVSDFDRARSFFYTVKRNSKDPDLACLEFRPSPHGDVTELWIVKKGASPDDQEASE